MLISIILTCTLILPSHESSFKKKAIINIHLSYSNSFLAFNFYFILVVNVCIYSDRIVLHFNKGDLLVISNKININICLSVLDKHFKNHKLK